MKINPKQRNRIVILSVIAFSILGIFLSSQLSTVPEAQYWENFGEAYVILPVWEGDQANWRKNFVIEQIITFHVSFSFNIKGVSNTDGIETEGFEDLDYWLSVFEVRILDADGYPLEGVTFKAEEDYRQNAKKQIEDIMFLPEFGKYTVYSRAVYTVMYWDEAIQTIEGVDHDFGDWWEQSYAKEKEFDFYYRDPAVYPDPDNANDPKWEEFEEDPASASFDFSLFGMGILVLLSAKRLRYGKFSKERKK